MTAATIARPPKAVQCRYRPLGSPQLPWRVWRTRTAAVARRFATRDDALVWANLLAKHATD